jgi:hypothetical protein
MRIYRWGKPDFDTDTLKGRKIQSVDDSGDGVRLVFEHGSLLLIHRQDCCENVYLDEVIGGTLTDLQGETLMEFGEATNADEPEVESDYESYTWTFYRIATANEDITLRWFGESNGYYSESISVEWHPATA